MKEIPFEDDHFEATGGFKVLNDKGEWVFTVRFMCRTQKWSAWADSSYRYFTQTTFDTEEEAREYAYAQVVKHRMKK